MCRNIAHRTFASVGVSYATKNHMQELMLWLQNIIETFTVRSAFGVAALKYCIMACGGCNNNNPNGIAGHYSSQCYFLGLVLQSLSVTRKCIFSVAVLAMKTLIMLILSLNISHRQRVHGHMTLQCRVLELVVVPGL